MAREFENIFEACLERVLSGEAIDACLQSYPQHAAQLKPLLETALAAKRASCIAPSAEFKARARYQFRLALQQAAAKKTRRPVFGFLPRWATVLVLVFGILAAGGGTVAAAAYSMPDSPLYSVKLATEHVQLTLTRSEVRKAEFEMELADRRVGEIIYLANKGDGKSIQAVTENLNERLEKLAGTLSEARQAGGGEAPTALQAPAAPPQTTTAAPTPAPAITRPSVQVPVPTATPAPAPPRAAAVPSPTPPPSITVPPPIITLPPQKAAAVESGDNQKSASVASTAPDDDSKNETPRMKLRKELVHYALTHPAALQKAMENAPESSREALREAIATLLRAYGKSLRALD